MRPTAHVSHASPGRIRLQLPGKRGDPPFFHALREALAELPAVVQVEVNPVTGGALLHHRGLTVAELADFGAARGLFVLALEAGGARLALEGVNRLLSALDAGLRQSSAGRFDGRSFAFVALIGLAGVQAVRGNLLAPATTLVWYAFSLLREKPGGEAPGRG